MATLTKETTSSPWLFSKTVSAAGTTTNNLATAGTFLDRNIGIKITTPTGAHSASISSHTVTNPSVQASIVGTITTKGGYGITTTKPSGTDGTNYLVITPKGTGTNGTSKASAKSTITTGGFLNLNDEVSSSESSATITPGVTLGSNYYIPIVSTTLSGGGVTKAKDYSGTPTLSMSIASQTTAGATYSDSAPSDGNYYIAIKSSSNSLSDSIAVTRADVKYSNNAGLIAANTNTVAGSLGTASVNVGVTVNAANKTGYIQIPKSTLTRTNGNVSWTAGYTPGGSSNCATTSMSQGTSSINGTTLTRGIASWGNGWINSGSIAAATFANTATTGKTYLDISDTTGAPVLVSGDYLYINKGYTDDLKISLAQLVPNGATAGLAAGYILSGYSAYNNDGVLVAGSIDTQLASGNTVLNGTTTLKEYPAGYYPNAHSVSHALGALTAGAGSISATPTNMTVGTAVSTAPDSGPYIKVSGSGTVSVGTAGWIAKDTSKTSNTKTLYYPVTQGTYGASITGSQTFTPVISKQTLPSGVTDAADGSGTTTAPSSGPYIAVQTASQTARTITATATISKSGWIDADSKTATSTVGLNASDKLYIPIKTTSLSAGAGSSAATGNNIVLGTKTTTKPTDTTSTYITVTGSGTVSVGTGGWINSGTSKVSNTATAYYPIAQSSITTLASLPSGASSSGTISRGQYIKIGAGYNTTDKYYTAQGDAHSSYTPSSTYFQTSTTGAVTNALIQANSYTTSNYYVKAGTLSSTGGNVSGTNATLSTSNTSGISVTGSGQGSVSTSGWIDAGASASSASSQTKYLTGVKLVPPGSGTRSFSIEVPNGSTTDFITFVFTVDSTGAVTVTET